MAKDLAREIPVTATPIILGSALMAIGDAFHPLIDLRTFNLNVGGEWSWIAMALLVLGNWDPLWNLAYMHPLQLSKRCSSMAYDSCRPDPIPTPPSNTLCLDR